MTVDGIAPAQELKKYALLMEIAEVHIDQLINLVPVPIYKKEVWPIILHMLAAIQHSPIIFNRILKLYAKQNPARFLPIDPQLTDQLRNTMCALLDHFPEHANNEFMVCLVFVFLCTYSYITKRLPFFLYFVFSVRCDRAEITVTLWPLRRGMIRAPS